MTAQEYKAARKERGTQQGVAALLGVDYHTIQRRESGEIKITREAEIALISLRKKHVKQEQRSKVMSAARRKGINLKAKK